MTNEFWFERHKFRYDRHKKACQTCKYHECCAQCNTCEINPGGGYYLAEDAVDDIDEMIKEQLKCPK